MTDNNSDSIGAHFSPPPLPSEVSANGQEIWDWAARLSAHRHRIARMAELQSNIATVRCGGCNHWMKSRLCPREYNVNGRNKGPSCNAPVCGKYVETTVSIDRRQRWRDELDALTAQTKSEGSQ